MNHQLNRPITVLDLTEIRLGRVIARLRHVLGADAAEDADICELWGMLENDVPYVHGCEIHVETTTI